MKIKRGTEVRTVLCVKELEASQDLIEATNRSMMTEIECRKTGKKPEDCAGLKAVILRVVSTKTENKMSGSVKRCPV